MKKLRLLALFAAVMLCLQSCGIIIINDIHGNDAEITSEDGTDRETESQEVKEIIIDKQTSDEMKVKADEVLAGVDTADYTGMRLLIATTDTTFYEGKMYDDGDTRLTLTSDRIIRSDKISGKLGANISIATYSEDDLYTKLSAAVKNKEYFADVLAVPQRLVGKLAGDGLIKSLRTVPGLDLKADYFNTDALSAFSAGHKAYAISGEGCFEPEKLYCVYFNKEMAAELGLDMYSLVSNGEWTLKKYAECISAASAAGAGTVVTKSPEKYKRMLLIGSGFDFVESGIDKVPAANTFSSEFEITSKLIASIPAVMLSSNPSEDFLNGKSLFFIDTVFAAEEMYDSDLVWGMLPLPKYNENYEYGTYAEETAIVLCVPEYASDDRMSGDFIEAFNAVSTGYLEYDYLYHSMLDVLRDNGSVNSLNIILKNPNYDFVSAMKSGYPTLYANTAGAFDDIMGGRLTFEEYKGKETEVAEYMEKWFPVTNK